MHRNISTANTFIIYSYVLYPTSNNVQSSRMYSSTQSSATFNIINMSSQGTLDLIKWSIILKYLHARKQRTGGDCFEILKHNKTKGSTRGEGGLGSMKIYSTDIQIKTKIYNYIYTYVYTYVHLAIYHPCEYHKLFKDVFLQDDSLGNVSALVTVWSVSSTQ